MEIKKFNAGSIRFKTVSEPTLRVSRRDSFGLNTGAISLGDFKVGEKLAIWRVKEKIFGNEETHYYLVRDDNGFTLKNPTGRNALHFISRATAVSLLNELKLFSKSYTFRLALEPTTLQDGNTGYCIITSAVTKN